MSAKKKRLAIVDAGSVYHPSYHVMSGFATRDGFPTGAVYGFTRTVLMLLREYPSDYVAITFDTGAPTHRHQKYENYKADRPSLPDDLRVQIPVIQEVVDALGIPRFAMDGFEADDLMATLACQATDQGIDAIILTGDKDMMQLVNEHVSVLKPSRQPGQSLELYDPEKVKAYLGVYPHQVADFLALVGDTADQIPGVPSVGKKTAQTLLEQFESLESLLERASEVENTRARNALEKHADQAKLSYDLAKLGPMENGPTVDQCVPQERNEEVLKALLEKLEFHSLVQELDFSRTTSVDLEVRIVRTPEEFDALIQRINQAPWLSFDLETTSVNERVAEIVGVSLSLEPEVGYYIPVDHEEASEQLDRNHVLEAFKPILEGELPVIGQNLKYDAKVLRRYGIRVNNIDFDTMLASYLIDPALRQHKLDTIARTFLSHDMIAYADLSHEEFRQVPIDEAATYAAEDAEVVVRAREVLAKEMDEKSLTEVFNTIEVPLIDVLADVELNGILFDAEVLEVQQRNLETHLVSARAELMALAGEEFNPSSPKQVAHILFDVLHLPVIKKTKTGPSTDASVLAELAEQHPLPEKLVAFREMEKLLNTYIRKLPDYQDQETKRIYTNYNQTVAATGRLSSVDPNLQNIPVRTALGGEVRKAFVAPPGRLLLSADYSQIELRVLAHLSRDKALIETFQRGDDLHERTACEIFRITPELITSVMRSAAKRVNFGILYGISAFRLAKELGVPQAEAKGYIDRFFEIYPGAKQFVDSQIEFAKANGFVTTLFGRRRNLPAINSRNFAQRSFDERNAVNAPIQGTAADLMKLAMIHVHKAIRSGDLAADMLLQVHDELIFEVDQTNAESVGQQAKALMESVYELAVPLQADIKTGSNWGEV